METPAHRYWWVVMAAGVLSLVVGVAALVYPGPTLLAVGFLFGFYLVLWGFMTLMGGAAEEGFPVVLRVLQVIAGLFAVLAGLALIVRPGHSVVIVALILGFWWVLHGLLQLGQGVVFKPGRAYNILWGFVGFIAGGIILAQPGIGLVTLVVIVSIGLIVQGVLEIVAASALRKGGGQAAGPGVAPNEGATA